MNRTLPTGRAFFRAGATSLVLAGVSIAFVGAAAADDLGPTSSVAGGSAPTTAASGSGSGSAKTTVAAPAPAPAPAPVAGSAAAGSVDHMALGRTAKDKSDWKTAISEFTLAVSGDPKSADANNLLGYSYRKSGNLPKAFAAYTVALKLNPKHLGALEYQGEAYVQNGQAAKAKANLATLAKVCGSKTCEQYVDLASFIANAPATKTK